MLPRHPSRAVCELHARLDELSRSIPRAVFPLTIHCPGPTKATDLCAVSLAALVGLQAVQRSTRLRIRTAAVRRASTISWLTGSTIALSIRLGSRDIRGAASSCDVAAGETKFKSGVVGGSRHHSDQTASDELDEGGRCHSVPVARSVLLRTDVDVSQGTRPAAATPTSTVSAAATPRAGWQQ